MPENVDDLPAAEEDLVSFRRSIPLQVENMLHQAVHTGHFERITHCDIYVADVTRQAGQQGNNKIFINQYYCRVVSFFRRHRG